MSHAAATKTPTPVKVSKDAPAVRCRAGASAEELLDAVFAKLHGRTLTAHFCQRYVDRVLGARPEECGTLLSHPDGRVRFDYTAPASKVFVYDGSRALFSEPDAAQVTYFDGFAQSPLAEAMAVLWGQGTWRRVFAVQGAAMGGETKRLRRIVLRPLTAQDHVERIEVVVDVAACEAARSELTDKLGNTTQYRIFDRRIGAAIAHDAFDYQVPASFSVLQAPS